MNEIKKILICGIGAIGSIYADKINKYNKNSLKILVDRQRLHKYKKEPKIFNGKTLDLNYILPEENNFKADLIIIATKSNGLNDAIKNIENFIKEDTIILSLLNGITSEDIIAGKYGWKNIIHSYFIGHSAIRNNNIITHDGVGDIIFGIKDFEKTDKNNLLLLKTYFDKVGISYKLSEDIYRSMWLKYMLNVSSNQTSAIFGMTFGQMQSNTKCRQFLKNIMQEVLNIAKACGVKNTDTMIEEAFKTFDKMSPDGKTSMLQDIEAHRKPEINIFGKTIIEYGVKYNIPTPYNNIITEMLEFITDKNE